MKKHRSTRFHEARRVTLVGALVNVLLAVLKVIVGWLGRSEALFADGIHSFSDLLTDLLVLFASKIGSQEPDREHPYGHARIETVATILVAVVLIAAGFGLIWDAFYKFATAAMERPDFVVVIVALISVVANEFIFHYTLRVGKRVKSAVITANAWHHRGDAFSSFIVLLSALGAYFGFHFLDEVGAVIVALMIIYMAGKMIWSCTRELVDTAVDDATLKILKEAVLSVSGVKSIHQLRTRLSGGEVFVDLHMQVGDKISVSEGHHIAEQIPKALRRRLDEIADVTVHVDYVETQDLEALSDSLPDRTIIEEDLDLCCAGLPGYEQRERLNIHYIKNKVYLELLLPVAILTHDQSAEAIVKQYQRAIQSISYIGDIKLLFFL